MSTAAQHLALQFHVAQQAGRVNLRGISAEEALEVPEGAGSSANWIVGPIVSSRGGVHGYLGISPVAGSDRLAAYARGSTVPSPEAAIPVSELIDLWKASQAAVSEALEHADDAFLQKTLDEPAGLLGDTVGSALSFLAFNEAYHVGQLGLTRRRLGKEGAIT